MKECEYMHTREGGGRVVSTVRSEQNYSMSKDSGNIRGDYATVDGESPEVRVAVCGGRDRALPRLRA